MKKIVLRAASALLILGAAACSVEGPVSKAKKDGRSSYNANSTANWMARTHTPPAGR